MRLKAVVPHHPRIRKLMMYQHTADQVYLFAFDTLDNAPCVADRLFASLGDAQEEAEDAYGVQRADWIPIADPTPEQAHDRES